MARKSPLKAPPLRTPGQSIDERIDTITEREALGFILLPLILLLLTLWSWLQWLGIIVTPNPWLMTAITLVVTAYSIQRLHRIHKHLQRLKLGRDGELAVGQLLDRFQRRGHRVFHDLVMEDYNLDHIIVSRHGIYTVETKTYSKPARGEARIIVTDTGLTIAGKPALHDTLAQAQAQRRSLERLIAERAGLTVTVQPIIAFPGWYIEDRRNNRNSVWILEPKAIVHFVENSPITLDEHHQRVIANTLSTYIRQTNRTRR